MRLFVVLAGLAIAPPAMACPTGALCAAVEAPRDAEVAAPKRPVSLRVDRIDERTAWNLRDAPEARPTDTMPWIWQVLRREVYDAMPRYRDDELTFVLSPVVISGSFDTVPGVGLAGDF